MGRRSWVDAQTVFAQRIPDRHRQRRSRTTQVVPFHQAWFGLQEGQAVSRAIRQEVLAGDGPIGRAVEAQLRELCRVRHALLMNSCTAAIEAALVLLRVAGGEVVMPSFAFPSAAAAVVRAGARPIFVDIDPQHLGLEPWGVERVLSPRTRAILYVDYGGFPGSIDAIRQLADRHRIPLIEDAAQALGSVYRGRPLGSWGTVGCVSFHQTKLVTCGEGGALLTNDDALAESASIYREYGTNRSACLRGEVDHYEWVGDGSSALLAEPLAALLHVQLERLPAMLDRRCTMIQDYREAFAPLMEAGLCRLPHASPEAQVNWHTFYLMMDHRETVDRFIAALAERHIDVRRHFFPLHRSAYARRARYATTRLPVTEAVTERLVRLPIYPALTMSQQRHVVRVILDFFRHMDVTNRVVDESRARV